MLALVYFRPLIICHYSLVTPKEELCAALAYLL
jgi:hypothetical protein